MHRAMAVAMVARTAAGVSFASDGEDVHGGSPGASARRRVVAPVCPYAR